MIQSLMLIALGFLGATLLAIVAVQLAWRRAVAVTSEKMRSELNLDEVRQAADHLANVEAALEDRQRELAETRAQIGDLSGHNLELETALAAATTEADNLRNDIAGLQAQHEAALDAAENEAQALSARHGEAIAAEQANAAALQSRIDVLDTRIVGLRGRIAELEAAAKSEIGRHGELETELQSLGEKAARLVVELTQAFGKVADAPALQAALATPTPVAGTDAPGDDIRATLSPYPAEDADDNLGELEEIKASLTNFCEGVNDEFGTDNAEAAPAASDDEAPLPSENFLAERIRALEEGVAPHH